MRGALIDRIRRELGGRIIPAYAGSTGPTFGASMVAWDHPRVCGEHPSVKDLEMVPDGSSPRMRGALGPCLCISVPPGIIPAYAGSTTIRAANENYSRDHPRVCGEHTFTRRPSMSSDGSSPRMRGAHIQDVIEGAA